MPSAFVTPFQNVLLSGRISDTCASATGSPSSRRVTKINVLSGLSFTLIPRFVTCTIEALLP
jgi:hypothetical protein